MPIKQGGSLAKYFRTCPPPQLTANDNLALLVNAMHLKNVLRDIQTDCANLLHGWLLACGSNGPALLAHCDAGAGAIHSINSGHYFMQRIAADLRAATTSEGLMS